MDELVDTILRVAASSRSERSTEIDELRVWFDNVLVDLEEGT